jgi:Reverse transcriptase (RNA-dependent DNA polymerase)
MDNVTFQATSDPDTLYYHQVLHEPDKHMFITAMEHEIKQHNDSHNWVPVKRSTVPSTSRVLPSVWSVRPKRDLTTGAVMKYKDRLNVDGSRQLKGIDFEETFAPVASWSSVRLILLLASIKMVHVSTRLRAGIPASSSGAGNLHRNRCNIDNNNGDYVLQVLSNSYGQRQAGKVMG